MGQTLCCEKPEHVHTGFDSVEEIRGRISRPLKKEIKLLEKRVEASLRLGDRRGLLRKPGAMVEVGVQVLLLDEFRL